MMKRLVIAGLCALSLACVSSHTFKTGDGGSYAPTRPADVLVFFSAEDVKRPYTVVAEIMTEGSSAWFAKDASLVKKAQAEAAKLGAQGVIITKEKAASATAGLLLGASDHKQRTQAIRFTASPSPAP